MVRARRRNRVRGTRRRRRARRLFVIPSILPADRRRPSSLRRTAVARRRPGRVGRRHRRVHRRGQRGANSPRSASACVEIGHAERRRLFGETDEIVAREDRCGPAQRPDARCCASARSDRGRPGQAAAAATRGAAATRPRRRAATGPSSSPTSRCGRSAPPSPRRPPTSGAVRTGAARRRDPSVAGSVVIYGGSAGPGLLTELGDARGRPVPRPLRPRPGGDLAAVLDEAAELTPRRGSAIDRPRHLRVLLAALRPSPSRCRCIDAFEDTRGAGRRPLPDLRLRAPLERCSAAELADLRDTAADLGLEIELGTKGIDPDHLHHFLACRGRLGASTLRTMLHTADAQADGHRSRELLRDGPARLRGSRGHARARDVRAGADGGPGRPRRATSGPTSSASASTRRTVVARLEIPRDVVERDRPVRQEHPRQGLRVRPPGRLGRLHLRGRPAGRGLPDYPHLLDTVRPGERGINQIVEHWLPWQGDAETTVPAERTGPEHTSNT